jgi:CxxC motif-containing protein (DUF1111 family)
MKKPIRAWYLLVALLALAPVGFRALTWKAPKRPAVDVDMAQAGETLFKHEWTPGDPLAKGGDGLGPVFNENSCVACHNLGGPGGGGGRAFNVTTFAIRPPREGDKPREGVVHAQAVGKFQETLNQVHPELPNVARPSLGMFVSLPKSNITPLRFPRGVRLSQLNTPALFGAKAIDEMPDRVIIVNERRQRLKWGMRPADGEDAPVGRAVRLPDGRLGRFGWKAQTASLAEFVQAACANELGLSNPGAGQPRPLGKPDYPNVGLDLTAEQCNQLTAFVASLPRPVERFPDEAADYDRAQAGKQVFQSLGCAECHTPNLGNVEGIYSDLLLHRMGVPLEGGGGYYEPPPDLPAPTPGSAAQPGEWRTPPLWGVADSAPYLHDGRATTLDEAVRLHTGQGLPASQRYARLQPAEQTQLIQFLQTLRAP